MTTIARSRNATLLRGAVIGDAGVLLVLTLIGFATHSSADAIPRLLATWVAATAAWAWVSPWFGVFGDGVLTNPVHVWRVAWAWSATAPLAVFLRSVALDRDVAWVFVTVVLVFNGLAMVAWRAGYARFVGGRVIER
jgi:hypothetical protein